MCVYATTVDSKCCLSSSNDSNFHLHSFNCNCHFVSVAKHCNDYFENLYIYIYTYIMFFLSIIFGTVSLWAKSMMIAGHMLQPRLIMSNFYNVLATAAHIKQDLSNATDPAFIICIFFVWRDEMYSKTNGYKICPMINRCVENMRQIEMGNFTSIYTHADSHDSCADK